MKLELDIQSPYAHTGEPRQDLPTGEVLAWDGKDWATGRLSVRQSGDIWLICENRITLINVLRFAPLPTIIEQDGNEVF